MAKDPLWLSAARARLGTREAAGTANSPAILTWAKKLGTKVLGMIYNADSVPWCGVFVAYCLAEDGIKAPPVAVRAMSWRRGDSLSAQSAWRQELSWCSSATAAATSASTLGRTQSLTTCSVAIRATRSLSLGLRRPDASPEGGLSIDP
jgi:hypothetical protein